MKINIASKNDIAEHGHQDEDIARVALSAFFNIAKAWGLSREASQVLLGSPSESTYYRWRQGKVATISKDTLERISVLLGIYKAAHILFPIASRANEYMHRANDDFAGKSALDVMLSGSVDALYQVRRYLDAWRG